MFVRTANYTTGLSLPFAGVRWDARLRSYSPQRRHEIDKALLVVGRSGPALRRSITPRNGGAVPHCPIGSFDEFYRVQGPM